MTDLKPCPFCGSDAVMIRETGILNGYCSIWCGNDKCNIHTQIGRKEEVIKRWENRSNDRN